MKRLVLYVAISFWYVILSSCGTQDDPTPYALGIHALRQEKDNFLRDPASDVLASEDRERFFGLRYFPVDSTFRFELPLQSYEKRDTVLIVVQNSLPDPYVRLGFVEITRQNQTHPLQVFKSLKNPNDSGWIPFTDLTSGNETYGGGRYLDIDLVDGMVVVDFNMAYNPYCDYNLRFNCALPPAENRLPFAITAGEKKALILGSS